jgi:glycosyltransferase involved in cell wall biosynthesis
MSRPGLSVCVMAMNEEAKIGDCLRSVDFADEWVVVDSHSTDRTREIAAALGARVIERDWPGWIAQNNFAVEQATRDWVLAIDADERVSPELRASILRAIERPGDMVGFTMPRVTCYMGRWIRHGGWYPDRKIRLFRRGRGRFEGVDPHPRGRVDGPVADLDGDLLHYSYDDLADHLRTIDRFTGVAARAKEAAGVRARVSDLTLRPFGKFLRMYVLKQGFRDGLPGFVVAITGAFYVFMKYAKLWEIRTRARDSAVRGEGSGPPSRG